MQRRRRSDPAGRLAPCSGSRLQHLLACFHTSLGRRSGRNALMAHIPNIWVEVSGISRRLSVVSRTLQDRRPRGRACVRLTVPVLTAGRVVRRSITYWKNRVCTEKRSLIWRISKTCFLRDQRLLRRGTPSPISKTGPVAVGGQLLTTTWHPSRGQPLYPIPTCSSHLCRSPSPCRQPVTMYGKNLRRPCTRKGRQGPPRMTAGKVLIVSLQIHLPTMWLRRYSVWRIGRPT